MFEIAFGILIFIHFIRRNKFFFSFILDEYSLLSKSLRSALRGGRKAAMIEKQKRKEKKKVFHAINIQTRSILLFTLCD